MYVYMYVCMYVCISVTHLPRGVCKYYISPIGDLSLSTATAAC